jgi:hypothetical protein
MLDKDKDVDTSSPQADHPPVLVMKTHNESVLGKDNSKSDVSASSKCFFNCIFSSCSFFCNKLTLLYVLSFCS